MYLKNSPKFILIIALFTTLVSAQFDLGEKRSGEHRGRLTPGQIATITIITIATLMALGVTFFFCYYVHRNGKKMQARYAYQDQRAYS